MNGCWIKGTSKKKREWEYIKTNEFLNLFLFLGMDIGYNEIQPFFLLVFHIPEVLCVIIITRVLTFCMYFIL